MLEKLLRQPQFVWIQRQLPVDRAGAIRALKLDGVDFLPDSKRYYPGQPGLPGARVSPTSGRDRPAGHRKAYNEQLAGQAGELIAPRDAKGPPAGSSRRELRQVPVNGSTLQLTLDATIQHLVEEALEEGMAEAHPATAYAVVVDPYTGEILAMAGTPTFDPNHILPKKFHETAASAPGRRATRRTYRQEQDRQRAARKVHPVEDSYEPGPP